jgi:3-methyladenine DNA glycosylase/8-oxoguanine DNA glycosylase
VSARSGTADVVGVGPGALDLASAVHHRWQPGRAVDVAAIVGPLRRGGLDPTFRWAAGRLWRTARTPDGPGTQLVVIDRGGGSEGSVLDAWSWGPGASWLADNVPALFGEDDEAADEFRCDHPLVREVWRRHRGWRVLRTQLVFEALVPAILEQKVTGQEATRSWRALVRRFGEPAPGPAPDGMRVLPAPETWARIPSWEWHRAGVGPDRSRTIVQAARRADALERTLSLDHAEADRRMRSLPGVGVWTSAEVRQRAHGDPDAVSVGDFHIATHVVYAMTGKLGGTDEQMLELLAPYAGHRYRVVRMIELSGVAPARRGPRYAGLDHRRR